MDSSTPRLHNKLSAWIKKRWLWVPLGFIALVLAHRTALIYRIEPSVSLMFLPSGVAIALGLFIGPMAALLVAITSVFMAPSWGVEGWTSIAGLTDGVEPLMAWFLYRYCWKGSLSLNSLKDAAAFVISAPIIACGSLAVVGSLTLALLGKMPLSSLPEVIPNWWVGNAIGTIAITPIALLILTPILQYWNCLPNPKNSVAPPLEFKCLPERKQGLEIGLILLMSAGTAALAVLQTQTSDFRFQQFSLLSFIPLIWAATRFGVRGGMLTVSFTIFTTLFFYVFLYPSALELIKFPLSGEILHIHKLSLIVQGLVTLLVGTAISEQATTQVKLALEQVRIKEYESRAQLGEKLLELNELLTEANQQLYQKKQEFRALAENSPDIVARFDRQLCHLYINPAIEEVTGFKPEELIGQTIPKSLFSDELYQQWIERLETVLTTGEEQSFEFSCVVADQSTRYYHTRQVPEFSENNRAESVLVVTRDITSLKEAQMALARTEELSRIVLENFPNGGVFLFDPDLRYSLAQGTGLSRLGMTPELLEGKTIWEVFSPEICATIEPLYRRALTGNGSVTEVNFRDHIYKIHILPVRNKQGEVWAGMVMTQDITEQKQTEEKLQKNQRFIQKVADTVPGLLYVYDLIEQRNIYLNHQVAELLGYTPNEIQQMRDQIFSQLMHPEDLQRLPSQLEQIQQLKDGEIIEFEFRMRHANGEWHWFGDRSMVFNRTATGLPHQLLGLAQDITERKQSEINLRSANERFRLATTAVNGLIYDWDLQTNIIERTEGLTKMLGYLPEEVEASSEWWWEQIHPDDRNHLPKDIATTQIIDDCYTLEYRVRNKWNQYVYVQDRGLILRDEQGNPVRVVGSSTDISERKQAEEKLRQKQAWLDLAQEAAKIGSFEWNIQTNTNTWSKELEALYGLQPGEFGGTDEAWLRLVHPDDVVSARNAVIAALKSGDISTDFRVIWPDGSIHWLHARAKVLYDSDGNPVRMVGVNVDISDRKQAEAALQCSETRLRRLVDSNIIGIIFADFEGNILEANEAFLELLGYTRTELEAGAVNWRQLTPPEYEEVDKQSVVQLKTFGVCTPFEKAYYHKSGQQIPVLLAVAKLEESQNECACFVLDLREQKRIEAERADLLCREQVARQQAEAASRMKDEFLAIVSHELRSPLNGILGWSRLLRMGRLNPEKTQQALASIERNAQAQTQLIEDLLDISRIIRGKIRLFPRPISLIPIINAALDTVRPTTATKNIQLESYLDLNVAQVSGDPERLQQVVWNLLSNAVKFTPDNGKVIIRLQQVGKQAQIQVVDTGQGINPEFLPFVFDRFRQADSTASRTQGGLGLGLAIVRSLVELHGGTVGVDSLGSGQGATFTITLPLLAPSEQTPQFDERFTQSSGSGEKLAGLKILVVDDDEDARDFLVAALSEYGAIVQAVGSTDEALQQLSQMKPDVLLSDIGMPGEDGYTLMRRVRSRSASEGGNIPAAALTAYAREEDRVQALEAGFQHHIPKPIDPVQLLAVVIKLAGRIQS